MDPHGVILEEEGEEIHAIWFYKKQPYIYLKNTKGEEISKKKILETPLPKKGSKSFEGFLSLPPKWLRRESFIGKMAKKVCKR